MRVLVTGATGFIGSRLVPELVRAGHEVRAMTRHPDDYDGEGTPVRGDVDDPGSLAEAMTGCDAVVYLVHAIGRDDVGTHDVQVARDLGLGAAAVGVRQIVYLGGLGDEDGGADADGLSEHLQSRRDVESALSAAGVPTTVLRAALVLGEGSLSWEILKQLVEKLPVLPVGPWRDVKVQPIGVADAVAYLVGVLGREEAHGQVYEIGGPDVMTYGELLERTGEVLGTSHRLVGLPALPDAAAAVGVRLLTDVDGDEAATLVESLRNEVVADAAPIRALVPRDLLGFEDQVRAALAGA